MEGVPLDAGTLYGRVDETEIEKGVVSHQNGAAATRLLDRIADGFEHVPQGIPLEAGGAQRMVGIDADEIQRALFQVGTGEGLHVTRMGRVGVQPAFFIHADDDRSDLQQGIGLGIESGRFHIHHHRQKAAETTGDAVFHAGFTHWRFSSRCARRRATEPGSFRCPVDSVVGRSRIP